MSRAALSALLSLSLTLALASCATVTDVLQKSGLNNSPISLNDAQKVSAAFRKSSEDISESEEYYIGRAVAAQVAARYPLYSDPAANKYVQTVLQVVAMGSDRPVIYGGYHAQILDSDEINAFSTPGGFVFVTRGLLKNLEDEDQLACVLGHELAHVAKKHGLKTIKASRLTTAFALLGQQAAQHYGSDQLHQLTETFGGSIDDIVGKLVVNGYSRDKEYEADHYGDLYAQRAEYDPAALSRFLSRLAQLPNPGSGFFKTHPPAQQRLEQLGKGSLSARPDYQASTARSSRFAAALGKLKPASAESQY